MEPEPQPMDWETFKATLPPSVQAFNEQLAEAYTEAVLRPDWPQPIRHGTFILHDAEYTQQDRESLISRAHGIVPELTGEDESVDMGDQPGAKGEGAD